MAKILNISFFAIRYIKLYSEIISSLRPELPVLTSSPLQVVEGAAGVVVGALRQVASQYQGQKVALLMCGANIGTDKLRSIVNEYYTGTS